MLSINSIKPGAGVDITFSEAKFSIVDMVFKIIKF